MLVVDSHEVPNSMSESNSQMQGGQTLSCPSVVFLGTEPEAIAIYNARS